MRKLTNTFMSFVAILFATVLQVPAQAQTQVTIKVVGTCGTATYVAGKMAYPTQDTTGTLCTTSGGGGGGGASATAASQGTVPVVAGTNKPIAIDLFSSTSVLVKDTTGTPIDWSAAVPVTQSGTWTVGLSAGTNNIGDVDVLTLPSLPAGANTIGAISNTSFAATQSGTWTVQPGNTANTTPWLITGSGTTASPAAGLQTVQGLQADDAALGATVTNPVPVGGIFQTTRPTYTTGDRAQAQFTANGELVTAIGGGSATTVVATGSMTSDTVATTTRAMSVQANSYLFGASTFERQRSIAGSFGSAVGVTAVEMAGTPYVRVSTNTSTNGIKSGAGILHRVCVNTKGASANTATLYDNTTATGTIIAVIDTTTANVACMDYDLGFTTGLSVLTATGTAADLTIVYR